MSTHLSVSEIFRKLEERMKLHEEEIRAVREGKASQESIYVKAE